MPEGDQEQGTTQDKIAVPDVNKAAVAEPSRFRLDGLRVPGKFKESESLTDAALAELSTRTVAFYEQQYIRMEQQEVPEKVRRSKQEVFDEQVETFCSVTDGIETAFRKTPGLNLITLAWDSDNTQGVMNEDASSAIVLPEELRDKQIRDLTPDEKKIVKEIYVKDSYDHWMWSPAFLVASKHIHEKYKNDPHRKVVQIVLTTREQQGLNDYFTKMLEKELPGVFDPRLIMSSRLNEPGSAAEELFPEITAALGPRDDRGRPANRLTLEQTLTTIQESDHEK